MKYQIKWLKENYDLENVNGRIIEILDKRHCVDDYENYWLLQCLIEIRTNKKEGN